MIRSSSSHSVDQLITDLFDSGEGRRASAVARLRVIGSRADERLAALIASDAPADVRAAAIAALEGRAETRAHQIAQAACGDASPVVATAAVAVLRGLVAHERGTAMLDTLSGIALDPRRDAAVRLAALDALSELPPEIVRPLVQRVPASLLTDTDPRAALDTVDDPLVMREWIAAHHAGPLSTLHEAIVRIRERERQAPPARIREAWLVARGAAHAAVSARGSRVALYDLRESFDAATAPLPLDFLSAVTAIGDASCLEPLARAWSASRGDAVWRDRLRDVAIDVIKKHKLTGRHAALKRVRAKYPNFV